MATLAPRQYGRPVARRLFTLLAVIVALAGCPAAVCDDCFVLEVAQADGSWGDCCEYSRASQDDDVLVRLERTVEGDYIAGLSIGCAWDADSPPYAPTLLSVDGEAKTGLEPFDVVFDGAGERIVSVDCDPARPAPAYPDVVVKLLDPALGAQFDPDGVAADDARVVLVSVPQ